MGTGIAVQIVRGRMTQQHSNSSAKSARVVTVTNTRIPSLNHGISQNISHDLCEKSTGLCLQLRVVGELELELGKWMGSKDNFREGDLHPRDRSQY